MHVALQERQLYFFMYQFIISICILGVLMMPAIVLVYIQLGQFLMSVMAFSWLYATFGFLSFCAVIGPVGDFGQLNITKYVSTTTIRTKLVICLNNKNNALAFK